MKRFLLIMLIALNALLMVSACIQVVSLDNPIDRFAMLVVTIAFVGLQGFTIYGKGD